MQAQCGFILFLIGKLVAGAGLTEMQVVWSCSLVMVNLVNSAFYNLQKIGLSTFEKWINLRGFPVILGIKNDGIIDSSKGTLKWS